MFKLKFIFDKLKDAPKAPKAQSRIDSGSPVKPGLARKSSVVPKEADPDQTKAYGIACADV